MVAGTLTAVSAVVIAFYTNSVSPASHGNFYELYAIAAAVVGGCSLRGGEGTILGIVLGTALLQVLRNLVNLLDVPSSLDFAVMGAVILIGAVADEVFGRRKGVKKVIQRREGLAVLGRRSESPACSTPPGRQSDATSTPAPAQSAPPITSAPFGTVGNTPVELYTLTNKRGLIAKITNYGGIVTELHVPDRAGRLADVVLGFETLDGYLAAPPYFGAIVGRVANRIGNAAFTLEGKRYTLAANDAPHHLHGGRKGWDKVVWSATHGRHGARSGTRADLHLQRRRRGLPGRRYGEDRLHAHQRQRAQGRDAGHDRCAHTRQHGAP